MSKECLDFTPLPARITAYDITKRLFDILVGTALLLLISPVLLVIAFWIRRTSPGSALYRQIRVGRDSQNFHVYKFRTMYTDADRRGPLITSSDDNRITPVGRFLRNSKLDELPQLFNVVKGDMSLVGPRPQVPRFVENFREDQQAIILAVRPGITGPTQLEFRDEESMLEGKENRERYYIEHLLPTKCQMDVDYVRRRSLRYDVSILLQTTRMFVGSLVKRLFRAVHLPSQAVVKPFLEETKEDPESGFAAERV